MESKIKIILQSRLMANEQKYIQVYTEITMDEKSFYATILRNQF